MHCAFWRAPVRSLTWWESTTPRPAPPWGFPGKTHMRPLTRRQKEIVSLLRQGLTMQEAAGRLGLKYGTVRQRLQQARERGGYRTTAQRVVNVEVAHEAD